MGKVIPLFKKKTSCDLAYLNMIKTMDKLELMEEMVRFQEERSRIGHLTREMILKGIPLFTLLERSAETMELRMLTHSYRRHLEHELAALDQQGPNFDPKNNF